MTEKPQRTYSFVGPEDYRPPNYERVVRALTISDLRRELAGGHGEPGYRDAVRAEIDRREEMDD